jgi:CheY-like chemotaxis protein
VLVVDDDGIMSASLQCLVAALGHRVEIAASGEEALARVEAGLCPGLVLLDVNMPGLGARGTLPRLRRLLPGVPVILMTGLPDQGVLELARTHPLVSLLAKPFALEDLRRHLMVLVPGN